MKHNYCIQKDDNRIISQYDTVFTTGKLIDVILTLIEPKSYNFAALVEESTQNKIMFSCGSIYCFLSRKLIIDKDDVFFAAKLNFTYKQFKDLNKDTVYLVESVLGEIFFNEEDLKYFLNYVITSISGINSFFKRSLILIGGRSSGKSLLLKFIYSAFGEMVLNDLDSFHLTKRNPSDSERSLY